MNSLFILLIFALAYLNFKRSQSNKIQPIPIRILDRKLKQR